MKKIILVLCALSAFCGSASALTIGGEPGYFMGMGAGARALAMGGAFTSIADDVSAGYWNAAGLAFLKGGELTAMHAACSRARGTSMREWRTG